MTVISELETASSTVRAALASPPNTTASSQDGNRESTRASTRGNNRPSTKAQATPMVGNGHNRVRTASLDFAHSERRGD